MDFQQELKQEMAKEEESLKGYFKEFKKPIAKDPTKISTSSLMKRGPSQQQWTGQCCSNRL
jgi:hypothetical protein